MASSGVAYFLWFFAGFFGLHHLYLGRIRHAFVWCVTLGGVFGLGWLRDFWRIPYYVQWRNRDKDFRTKYLNRINKHKNPTCGFVRWCGMSSMGYLASLVFAGLLPNYYDEKLDLAKSTLILYRVWCGALIIIGSAFGAYVVANIGEVKCSFIYPFGGALLGIPWIIYDETSTTLPTTAASIVAAYYGLRWRSIDEKPSSNILNLLIFVLALSIWTVIFGFGCYHHAKIPLEDGTEVPLKDAIHNFLSAPFWRSFWHSCRRLYDKARMEGWYEVLQELVELLDFEGDEHALEVLELPQDASQQEINKQCRKLSSKFHPDRYKTPGEKAEAEAKFMKIREACNNLILRPYQRPRHKESESET